MSAEIRQALAEAASTVEGISCSPQYAQLARPGQACVRRDRIEYPNPFGGVGHWSVVVCLGQDMATAETLFDQYVPPLVEALGPVLAVQNAAPQKLQLADGTTVLAAFINGFREE